MQNPNFSSGPCSKRPAWNIDALKNAPVGRSHRSALGKERIVKAINDTRKILNIPADYLVGIMPASDTGAFECAMWSLLGPKPVTVLVWESFSDGWATDVESHHTPIASNCVLCHLFFSQTQHSLRQSEPL